MEIKEQIKTLKAQAYDLLVMKEQYQLRLGQVNQQIAELSQKANAEIVKSKKQKESKEKKDKKDKEGKKEN